MVAPRSHLKNRHDIINADKRSKDASNNGTSRSSSRSSTRDDTHEDDSQDVDDVEEMDIDVSTPTEIRIRTVFT